MLKSPGEAAEAICRLSGALRFFLNHLPTAKAVGYYQSPLSGLKATKPVLSGLQGVFKLRQISPDEFDLLRA